MLDFYAQVTRLLRERKRFAVVTILDSSGSTPRKPGAKMIVLESGKTFFSIGGGPFEAMVVEDSRKALMENEPRIREYRFSEKGEGALGMVCGGRARVLMEVLRGPDRLLVFGGGHVGEALVEKAGGLGFEVQVVEDRPEFVDPERFPPGTSLLFAGPDYSGEFPEPDAHTFVCILTRCHRTDLAVLRRVIRSPAAYIGMIGSRRKAQKVLSQLESEGVPRRFLEAVHAPIGLDIGGSSPPEIALSILAEVIQVRHRLAPRERPVTVLKPAREV